MGIWKEGSTVAYTEKEIHPGISGGLGLACLLGWVRFGLNKETADAATKYNKNIWQHESDMPCNINVLYKPPDARVYR